MEYKKGKCFSMADQGQRNKSDFYQTPKSLTNSLIKKYFHFLKEHDSILEPCSGKNAIINVFNENKINKIIGKDLIFTGDNFYEETGKYDLIVTNPPYKKTHLFIEKCFDISDHFFLLLPLNHLQGQKRYNKKTYKYLNHLNIFTKMAAFEEEIRNDGKFNTGMQSTAWYFFTKNIKSCNPIIDWFNVDDFVLRKEDIEKDIIKCNSKDIDFIFKNTKCISKKKIETTLKRLIKIGEV